MTHSPTALVAAGRALWGEHWLRPMSEALHVKERTLRRMIKNQHPIPDGVWCDLTAIADQRSLEIATGLKTLREL